jgi:hypothetical protein
MTSEYINIFIIIIIVGGGGATVNSESWLPLNVSSALDIQETRAECRRISGAMFTNKETDIIDTV